MLFPQLVPGEVRIVGENLQVAYNMVLALNTASFEARGRIIGVIGHNGSGKSTLLKSILQLLEPRQGSLNVHWSAPGETRLLLPDRDMAFSPENGAIFEDLPVESYIKLWCRIKRNDSRYYRRAGSVYLEKLNIAPLLHKPGRELSKGQKRRVQAAVGFLSGPRLFLFDEPFDGLDIVQSNELANIMIDEAPKMGIILSSHRMELIERLADYVIVLKDGQVFASGGVEEVCSFLGGQSAVIDGLHNEQVWPDLIPLLKREFYSCLVYQIGSQLLITGPNLSLDALRLFLLKQRLQDATVHSARPSLVDAMQHHLNKLN